MKKSVLKRRSLIITTLLAAATVGYVVFIFLPKQREISELRAELIEKQEYNLKAKQLGAKIVNLASELGDAEQFLTDWRNAAPSELSRLYADVTEDVDAAGVSLSLFDPQPAVNLETISQVPVSITVHGTFEEIFDFVDKIEARPATIWMESLALETVKTRGKADELELVWGMFPYADRRKRLCCEMTLLIFVDNAKFSG